MRIVGAASAFRNTTMTKRRCVKHSSPTGATGCRSRESFELLHSNVGVNGRYLSLPIEEYAALRFSEANDVWIRTAIELGEKCHPGRNRTGRDR